jgi:hypothetical protein
MDNLDIDELPNEETIALQIEQALRGGAKTVRAVLDQIKDSRGIVLLSVFRCLGAHKKHFQKGKSEAVVEHDFRTQLDAAKLLLAYGDGLPLQSVATVDLTPGRDHGLAALRAQAASSSAIRDSLRQMLDELDETPVEIGPGS